MPKLPVDVKDIGAVLGFIAAVAVSVYVAKKIPYVKSLI